MAIIDIVEFAFPNTAQTIGIRIPNVPQLVPVANAISIATIKIITGRNNWKCSALPDITVSTKSVAPRSPVIALSDHANVRIMIAGTMAMNPFGILSIKLLNESTLLQR